MEWEAAWHGERYPGVYFCLQMVVLASFCLGMGRNGLYIAHLGAVSTSLRRQGK